LGLATCKKTVARITYTVLVETLNPAQSINQFIDAHFMLACRWLGSDCCLV